MEIIRRLHKNKHGAFDDYLDEAVYGANDGIITTFAVVSGATGATLGGDTIIILGIANLVADAFSMGASSFLAIRTKEDVQSLKRVFGRGRKSLKAVRRSLVTFGAFIVAGVVPLLPFLYSFAAGHEFAVSAIGAGITFFVVGGLRTVVTRRGFWVSGLEMFAVGSIAATLAYTIGYVVHAIIT